MVAGNALTMVAADSKRSWAKGIRSRQEYSQMALKMAEMRNMKPANVAPLANMKMENEARKRTARTFVPMMSSRAYDFKTWSQEMAMAVAIKKVTMKIPPHLEVPNSVEALEPPVKSEELYLVARMMMVAMMEAKKRTAAQRSFH